MSRDSSGQMQGFYARVTGLVQGVAFRDFVRDHARRGGLVGYVRNLPDGSVEVVAEGKEESLEPFIQSLWEGPPAARVRDVQTRKRSAEGRYAGFEITL